MTAQLGCGRPADGNLAPRQAGGLDASLGSGQPGSQYVSEQFQRLMADSGIVCSMSRSGNVWDNAAMDSFFSSLKTVIRRSDMSALLSLSASWD